MHPDAPPQDVIDPEDDMEAHPGKIARKSDPQTSKDAAREAFGSRSQTHRFIEQTLREKGPMTDEQLGDAARYAAFVVSPSGLRTRRAELVEAGIVTDSGRRARTTSGRKTIVWEIASTSSWELCGPCVLGRHDACDTVACKCSCRASHVKDGTGA